MVTTIGNESDFRSMVTNLIYLERNAIAAYESAVEKLSDNALTGQVQDFLRDHRQHLQVLTGLAEQAGAEMPAEGDTEQLLTTGKGVMACFAGDDAVLKAIRESEDDTLTAYKRAAARNDVGLDELGVFENALNDECRHQAWFEQAADTL